MKRLTLDIETEPNMAYVWGLWQQNVGLSQIVETSRMMCWAAKWHDDKKVVYRSYFHHGNEDMIGKLYELMDEADAVITWNGDKFDLPIIRTEFALAGLTPPSPTISIDLLRTAKKQFRLPSNKLNHVADRFELGQKLQHSGFDLWKACMAGDKRAWATMRRYNIQDVRLTESVYDRLLPWIVGHPSVPLVDGTEGSACPRCGAVDTLQKRGYQVAQTGRYQRYACTACGAWTRGTVRDSGVQLVAIA